MHAKTRLVDLKFCINDNNDDDGDDKRGFKLIDRMRE